MQPTAGPLARPARLLEPRTWPRRARLAGHLAVGAVAVTGATLVFLVDPAQPGHYPTCPFKAVTGLDCPGCGSMRALHQTLHGHLGTAADYNLLFLAGAPFLAVAWLVGAARLLGAPTRTPTPPRWLSVVIPVVVVVFWAVRNLPGPPGHWLHS